MALGGCWMKATSSVHANVCWRISDLQFSLSCDGGISDFRRASHALCQ
jgi:hypothetical protein